MGPAAMLLPPVGPAMATGIPGEAMAPAAPVAEAAAAEAVEGPSEYAGTVSTWLPTSWAATWYWRTR